MGEALCPVERAGVDELSRVGECFGIDDKRPEAAMGTEYSVRAQASAVARRY